MTAYRVCAFGPVEPTIELFGRRYGVCALKQECPRGECGYLRTRRIIETADAPDQPQKPEQDTAAMGTEK